ncbi:unnamed protein product [Caenorhabditis angaria]|uniref:F-box domain-containing protein n=1 Tax=Caenorhabditis angaria TaxID=860376 RepID=A0A9P1ISM5_9PELO|nr:unnamed protein product [Caenorhabditis angaria]
MKGEPKQEPEKSSNPFQKLPYEMNEMILKNVDPISMLNFGKTSKFCDGLAANFDDRLAQLSWDCHKNDDLTGQNAFMFDFESFPGRTYCLETRQAPNKKGTSFLQYIKKALQYLTILSFEQEAEANSETLVIFRRYNSSTKTIELSGYFFDLMEKHHNSITNLSLDSYGYNSKKIIDNVQFYESRFPRSLKNFCFSGDILHIRKFYSFHCIQVVAETRLTMNEFEISDFKLSSILDICKEFLNFWKDGDFPENVGQVGILRKLDDFISMTLLQNDWIVRKYGAPRMFEIIETNLIEVVGRALITYENVKYMLIVTISN